MFSVSSHTLSCALPLSYLPFLLVDQPGLEPGTSRLLPHYVTIAKQVVIGKPNNYIFDLHNLGFSTFLSVVVWHQTNVKSPTSVIEQLTPSTLTKVLLKCRFSLLFSFTVSITLLYVPMTSITCLPLQSLPTVNSVFP